MSEAFEYGGNGFWRIEFELEQEGNAGPKQCSISVRSLPKTSFSLPNAENIVAKLGFSGTRPTASRSSTCSTGVNLGRPVTRIRDIPVDVRPTAYPAEYPAYSLSVQIDIENGDASTLHFDLISRWRGLDSGNGDFRSGGF
jgi:hypothetical protein